MTKFQFQIPNTKSELRILSTQFVPQDITNRSTQADRFAVGLGGTWDKTISLFVLCFLSLIRHWNFVIRHLNHPIPVPPLSHRLVRQ